MSGKHLDRGCPVHGLVGRPITLPGPTRLVGNRVRVDAVDRRQFGRRVLRAIRWVRPRCPGQAPLDDTELPTVPLACRTNKRTTWSDPATGRSLITFPEAVPLDAVVGLYIRAVAQPSEVAVLVPGCDG